jgi:hypothetical protein
MPERAACCTRTDLVRPSPMPCGSYWNSQKSVSWKFTVASANAFQMRKRSQGDVLYEWQSICRHLTCFYSTVEVNFSPVCSVFNDAVSSSDYVGRAIVQAISRRLLSAAARVWSRSGHVGLGHWGRFSPSTSVLLANSRFTNCSTLFIIIIIIGWYKGPTQRHPTPRIWETQTI